MVPSTSAAAIAFGERSLALARAHGLEEQAAYTLSDLQYAYRAAGEDEPARAVLAEARAIWRRRQQPHMLADNLNQSAIVAQLLGDLAAAEQAAHEALALSGPTQNVAQALLGRELLASIYLEQGRYAAAVELLEAIDLSSLGFFGAPVYIVMAHRWAFLGQWRQALATMEAAQASAPSGGFALLFRYGQLGYTAYLHAQAGQLEQAEAAIREGLALPAAQTRLGFANFGYYLPLAQATVAVARRQWAVAEAILGPYLATLKAKGPKPPLAEALLLLSQSQAATDASTAGATLAEAAAAAEVIGQRRMAWRAWHALAEWQAAHGEPAAAQTAHQRARAHLDVIWANLGAPAVEAEFRNLPAVQAVLHWNT
jgi:hypothetical protein